MGRQQARAASDQCPKRVTAGGCDKQRASRAGAWGALAAACLCLASPAAGVAAQLPPEIQADLYREQVKQRLADRDYAGAKQLLDRILGLQQEHSLELPDGFYFEYGEVSQRAGLHQEAVEALTRYLTLAGQEGEHYRSALTTLIEAREALDAVEIASTQAALPAGASRVFDGMEFVWVPAGEFRMGSVSPGADDDEQPVTRVRISRGFWLGKHEVTQAEWQGVMGTVPSENSGCDRCPAERVSWADAQEFIRSLNGRSGGNRYRLPREAEWEYAARAGTIRDRYSEDLDAIAWYDDNAGGSTHPVGQKDPNAWGLHDMLGNVWEWVQDWKGEYPGRTVTDPTGPSSGSSRVDRGGSWLLGAGYCRASFRFSFSPGYRNVNLGFRLLRTE